MKLAFFFFKLRIHGSEWLLGQFVSTALIHVKLPACQVLHGWPLFSPASTPTILPCSLLPSNSRMLCLCSSAENVLYPPQIPCKFLVIWKCSFKPPLPNKPFWFTQLTVTCSVTLLCFWLISTTLSIVATTYFPYVPTPKLWIPWTQELQSHLLLYAQYLG